jgi:protein phosphatase 2C family protein 2/3
MYFKNEKKLQPFFGTHSLKVNPGTVTDCKLGPFAGTVCSLKGRRPWMEDTFLSTILQLQQKEGPAIDAYLFGILDGHGGVACANFVQDNFPSVLKRHLESCPDLSDYHLFNAFKLACVETNDEWKTKMMPSGTTASFVVIIGKQAWSVNVGDSGAILVNKAECVRMSEPAKPNKLPYVSSIIKRGGCVWGHRLQGSNSNLGVARTFGNHNMMGVTCRPKIQKWDFSKLEDKKFIIIASDGLWDVIGEKEAAMFSDQLIIDLHRKMTIEEMPAHLAKESYDRGSEDNISVMTINLTAITTP